MGAQPSPAGRASVREAPDSGHRLPERDRRPLRFWLPVVIVAGLAAGAAFRVAARRPHPAAAPVAAAAPSPLPPAEQALRDTLARLPRDADAHRALARYLLEQRRPFEALWHFQAAQDLNPAGPDASIAVARTLAQAGFPDRAISLLRARLARSPADLDARRALAEIDLAIARPHEAVAALAGAGTALSTSAPAQLLLGDARVAEGDAAAARVAYHRAAELDPEGAAGHDRLGRLALARGDWAEAKREFGVAREREPGEAGYGFRLGQAYWGAGERLEATQLWQEVASSSPDYAPVQLALGKAYQGRRDLVQAARCLVAAVSADPASKEAQSALAVVMTAEGDRASACYQRGIYALETDRPDLAVAAFEREATLAPERVNGPRMASLAYTQMKRLDLAAAAAQRGLERHPHDPQLLGQLALLHILGRNRPRAAQLCQEWLKTDPNAAEPYRLLARIAREEQRLSEALRLDEQALAREPQNALVCSDLARTLGAIGGPENNRRALDVARRATALNPREADDWLQLGTLLRTAASPEAAAGAFLRALDLDPSTVESCSALSQIAGRENRAGPARFYASLLTEMENTKRTRDILWGTTYRHPEDAAAHERLARSLLAAGDLRRAGYQFQQVVTLRPTDPAARHDLLLVQRLLDLQTD
jgi:tetratricopeptide (TPR) repeat protein